MTRDGERKNAPFLPELPDTFHNGRHSLDIRVYYEDTDAEGIVYYASYLRFMERGRTEFLRAAGLSHGRDLQAKGYGYVVARLELDYKRPARLDDVITVTTQLDTLHPASVVMAQTIWSTDQTILVAGKVRLVCVDLSHGDHHTPVRVSPELKAFFQAYRPVSCHVS